MIIEFTVANYRSFREKQFLSLIADDGKKHEQGDHFKEIKPGVNVLTSTVVYGANASGKSNLLRAMQSLRNLVLFSANSTPEKAFVEYDPFKFHPNTTDSPTHFGIDFLIGEIQYQYEISILKKEVVSEALHFYPEGREAKLFSRNKQDFEFGDYLKGQKAVVARLTGANQLFLSKAAVNNISQLVEVFRFFDQDFMTIPFLDNWIDNRYTDRIAQELLKGSENEIFIANFKTLLTSFDTGIVDFKIEKNEAPFTESDYDIMIEHHVFDDDGKEMGSKRHPIKEESAGTQKLFVLAGLILRALLNGRVIIIDEFERSLHPSITTFIIQLFHDPKINQHGAQLIIATHDTNLLSESQLRRDQIWIVEKDHKGASSLFSLTDINGVRSDIPFEKWYLSGRFGGVPGIEKLNLELNFQHEEA